MVFIRKENSGKQYNLYIGTVKKHMRFNNLERLQKHIKTVVRGIFFCTLRVFPSHPSANTDLTNLYQFLVSFL